MTNFPPPPPPPPRPSTYGQAPPTTASGPSTSNRVTSSEGQPHYNAPVHQHAATPGRVVRSQHLPSNSAPRNSMSMIPPPSMSDSSRQMASMSLNEPHFNQPPVQVQGNGMRPPMPPHISTPAKAINGHSQSQFPPGIRPPPPPSPYRPPPPSYQPQQSVMPPMQQQQHAVTHQHAPTHYQQQQQFTPPIPQYQQHAPPPPPQYPPSNYPNQSYNQSMQQYPQPIQQPPQQHRPPIPSQQSIPQRQPLQEKDKIDPSQIPRIPLFTRPHHAPSALYPPTCTPGLAQVQSQPPPADSRYVYVNSINVNPRLMRGTVNTFPRGKDVDRKCGVPLGLVVTPLACLTEFCRNKKVGADGGVNDNHTSFNNGEFREMGDVYQHPDPTVDYTTTSTAPDPELIPILRTKTMPPRCTSCHAYLNPHCIPTSPRTYHCNFCSAKCGITVPEEYISYGLVDKATRMSSVEYEVDGPYVVRPPVDNVRLYGVEYTPEHCANNAEYYHGCMKSFGWNETMLAMKEVVGALRDTRGVKVGIFVYCGDMLIFPHIPPTKEKDGEEEDADEAPPMEINVAIVSDMDDPFCPLPLQAWTYEISDNDMDWLRFCKVVDSLTGIMESLTRDWVKEEEMWKKNCSGAAMAALVDTLKDSGGRATLITTQRPNHGAGALRDRESSQPSHYMKASSEKRLFTPLQHLTFTATALKPGEEQDRQASLFYKKLGEDCAKSRVSLDIVVTGSLLKSPMSGMGANNTNVREFLDVATLAELCRVSCGKFKWLRVGNECGIAVDQREDDAVGGCSFTAEQLREELKRSALAYMGSDAVFKLRCSNGIQVKSYSPTLPTGAIVGDGIVDSAELELSSVDSSTTIAVLLEHKIGGIVNTLDPSKKDSPMVFFQSALLYTTLTGKRRVRVSTLGLPTTKVAADVFKSADLGTVATIMTRQAVSDVIPTDDGLKSARYNVFDQCVSILANYRLHTNARTSSSGQLILPESLQLLPLFCLSLRKSRMFRHSLQNNIPSVKPSPTADERAYHLFYASMVSPNIALQSIHPNVFQISDMRARDGEWITPPVLQANKLVDEDVISASMRPVCQLPKSTNPSITCLDENGMYILDDRFALYLFVGKDVPEDKWRELICVKPNADSNNQSYNGVPVGALSLASTEGGHKLRSILRQLRMMNAPNPTLALNVRPTHAPLILVFVGRGSVFEGEMDSLLVDDPDMNEKSYVDFLCTIHRAIRDKNVNAE